MNCFTRNKLRILKKYDEKNKESNKYRLHLEELIDEKTVELEKANNQLLIERDLALALGATSSLEEVLQLSLDAAIIASGMDSGGIYLVDDTGCFRLAFTRGLSNAFVKNVSYYSADTDRVRFAMRGRPAYVHYEDYGYLGLDTRQDIINEGIKSAALVPVHQEGRVIALLNIASHTRREISTAARNALETIGAHIGNVIARVKAEEEYRKSEQKYRSIVEQSKDGIVLIDSTEKIIEWNESMESISGLKKEEVLGESGYEILYKFALEEKNTEKTKQQFKDILNSNLKQPGPWLDQIIERRITGADGKQRVVQEVNFIINTDKELMMGSIIRDITRLRRAEENLRQSQKLFSIAFNNSPQWVSITTLYEGRYIKVNESFCTMLGYTSEEAIGQSPIDLNIWSEDVRAKFLEELIEHGEIRNYEAPFRAKDGRTLLGLTSSNVIVFKGEQCLISIVTDITDLKKLENEVARLDRLNLVGEMAASIGHEIRNPLSIVRGFLQLLENQQDCTRCLNNHQEYFELMIAELDRANAIITEFLSLAKSKTADYKPVNLNTIVESLLPLLKADAIISDKSIKVEMDDLPDLLLDEKEIRQMILNLVRNGLEAMDSRGTVTLRTFSDGEDAVLVVKDEGQGISPELLEKLGTPFVTTKENGTGLGLSVCYSIAERNKARIEVKTGSEGTAFSVRFHMINSNPQTANCNSSPHRQTFYNPYRLI